MAPIIRKYALVTILALVASMLATTFTAPHATAEARTVESACPEAQVPAGLFDDVPPENVHLAAIDCVAWWGILQGSAPDRFTPSGSLTRGQVASLVVRIIAAAGSALPDAPSDHFVDDDGTVHELSINRLADLGIARGTSTTNYSPGASVTRAQLASLLAAGAGYIRRAALPDGPDAYIDDDGSVHERAINALAEAGVVAGTAPRLFSPGSTTTRAQAASTTARLVDLLVDQGLVQRGTGIEAATNEEEFRTGGQPWDREITFAFVNDTADLGNERDVVRGAITRWQEVSSVRFREVPADQGADVTISYATGCHAPGDCFDGRGNVLAHARLGMQPNFVHFDDAEDWADQWRPDGGQPIDLYTVALHELGHVIGLHHSDDPTAVMYWRYTGSGTRDLRADDIAGAQALYPQDPGPGPTPAGSIALAQGAAAPAGYWYSVVLSGFAPGASVTVTCHDSVDPQGFWTQTFTIDGAGHAADATLCYSSDGPDHWVTGGGLESNHVAWSGGSQPPPPPPPTPATISLSRGGGAPAGFWYSVVLSGFAPGSSVTVTCRDSVDPQGFWTQTFTIDGAGHAADATLCYSGDGPDHWVTGGGLESNHVGW